jgi:hypothetical protein
MSGKSEAQSAFAFLETEFGFGLREFNYSAPDFGNFTAEYVREGVTINIWRDRGQVFVELTGRDAEWRDKEDILEEQGITRDRHPTENGLWSGYELESQSSELRRYLPQLIAALGKT